IAAESMTATPMTTTAPPMTTTAPPLLAVESLCVSIGGAPIIQHLSFRVEAGEIVGLAGASGSGKSMTALAIMRLLPPRARLSGAVYLNRSEEHTSELQSP